MVKSFIPLSGLVIYLIILLLEGLNLLPVPSFDQFIALYGHYSFILLFAAILIESIVYLGFYFPGQLFAVLMVIQNDFTLMNVILLTIISIISVVIAASINYTLGYLLSNKKRAFRKKDLLIAMLHINLLALYMFELGASRAPKRSILYAGFLNIPYYMLLIAGTFLIKDQLMIIEDSYFLLFLIIAWSIYAVIMDVVEYRKKRKTT